MPQFNNFFGYRIYYWSDEGKPLEPLHFHVAKKPRKNATKVWILSDGTLSLEYMAEDIDKKTLNRILLIMEQYLNEYKSEWESFFGIKATYIDLQN